MFSGTRAQTSPTFGELIAAVLSKQTSTRLSRRNIFLKSFFLILGVRTISSDFMRKLLAGMSKQQSTCQKEECKRDFHSVKILKFHSIFRTSRIVYQDSWRTFATGLSQMHYTRPKELSHFFLYWKGCNFFSIGTRGKSFVLFYAQATSSANVMKIILSLTC